MARSRPKLSQAPWTGLEAIRKIMERFAEFGENLNRMGAALHNLENSMQHLLGVTSRVTAAMLLLHGSLSHVGSKSSGSSDEKRKERSKEFEEEQKTRDKQADLRYELKNLRQKLGDLSFKKTETQGRLDRRLAQTHDMLFRAHLKKRSAIEEKIVREQIDPQNMIGEKNTFTDLKQAQLNTTTNKKIARVHIDTEYGAVGKETTSHTDFRKKYDKLDAPQQNTVKAPTEISVRAVNDLGQTIAEFNAKLKPALKAGNKLFTLSTKGGDEVAQQAYEDKLEADKSSSITMAQAAKQLKQFAQTHNLDFAEIAKSLDPTQIKMGGKNFEGADLPVLTNSFGKKLGEALSLKDLAPENKHKSVMDPLTYYFEGFQKLVQGMNPEALKSIADNFGLDSAQLDLVAKNAKGIKSQEDIAKLFKMPYNAHIASEDTKAEAQLVPLMQKLFQIAQSSLDSEAMRAAHGVSDQALTEKLHEATEAHKTDPSNTDLRSLLTNIETETSAVSKEEEAKKLEYEESKKPKSPSPIPPSTSTSWFSKQLDNSPILRSIKNNFTNVDLSKIMGKGFKDVVDVLKGLPKQIATMGTAVAGATMGLAQMASPDVFATFQGSLQILGATLGSALKKPVLEFAYLIQQAAWALQGMSPETRKLIGTIGELALVVSVAAVGVKLFMMVFGPLKMAFQLLVGLFKGLGVAIQAGRAVVVKDLMSVASGAASTAANFGRFALGSLKLIGVTGLLLQGFLSLVDVIFGTNLSLSKFAANLLTANIDKGLKAKEDADSKTMYAETPEELKKAQANYGINKLKTESFLRSSDESFKAFAESSKSGDLTLNENLKNHPFMMTALQSDRVAPGGKLDSNLHGQANTYRVQEKIYREAKASGNEPLAENALSNMVRTLEEVKAYGKSHEGGFFGTKPKFTAETEEQHKTMTSFVQAYGSKSKSFNAAGLTHQEKAERKKAAQDEFDKKGGYQGLLASFQSFRSQPQYMGVEEAHRRVQVQALSMDPIEAKLNEIKSGELAEMIRLMQIIAKPGDQGIINYMSRITGLAPGKGS